MLQDGAAVPYDSLIIATGAMHAYFGHNEWAQFAPGLKTLEDATTIRRKLLLAFERAEREPVAAVRQALLTFVIVGGGATGVELAGAIAELARDTLRHEFKVIQPEEAKVILVEGGERVMGHLKPELSAYAMSALEKLGVIVELGAPVTEVTADGVAFNGRRIQSKTVLWAAGVQSSPAAQWLRAPADKAGRVQVEPDLSVPGHPEIFVVGDAATIMGPNGKPVPGISDAAKQGGRHAARAILGRLRGKPSTPFAYRHFGDAATIGKRAAVLDFGWIRLTGWIAWWGWGLAHIYFLIGVRNRIFVALSWLWIYLLGRRSSRLITQGDAQNPPM
jgi:NADH dehydrogenase